ncbi:MAG: cation:proton antiporter [Candidatus Binatia bacterium]|nr:cation:proton antiporter [Candidatus Binatia bacterium]
MSGVGDQLARGERIFQLVAQPMSIAPASHGDLLGSIGLCVTTAAVCALVASRVKQPLLLAYLVAGLLIGPEVGFGWITDTEVIAAISEIGLILLLFLIGLEMDLHTLRAAGKPVLVTGVLQFLLCVALGGVFYPLLGFRLGEEGAVGGPFGLAYLAVTSALSSTMIVVKLLYDKFELDTLPGRITLGILVCQDIWAILVLALQPNLLNPQLSLLLLSFAKGAVVVAASFVVSRYVLPGVFRSIAKLPEVMLLAALAWCFLVCTVADAAGLSREMGALIAGVAMSVFPYGLDITAKITSIRDFFVTLFFVALGMQIPLPTFDLLLAAMVASGFLIASRFLSVFPVLYLMRYGHRVSVLPAINLAQMSEFSLVIASLGLAMGHIDQQTVSLIICVFALTSIASTYMIPASHTLAQMWSRWLTRFRVPDLPHALETEAGHRAVKPPRVVFLGFFRQASAILHEFELASRDGRRHPLLDDLLVIDFNPVVHRELQRRGIRCLYGDIAHGDTLKHAELHDAALVVVTLPDTILKGTSNAKLLQQLRRLCPAAKVVVTAEGTRQALALYEQGADYVVIPYLHSAAQIARIIEDYSPARLEALRVEHLALLRRRQEVLP